MALSKQPYKGTRDFYPEDKRLQKWLFNRMRKTVEKFGYQEYDAPLLEPVELYAAKSGDELVNEQTYTFTDRGGRDVVIRPEMTPSVSRMVAARRQEFAYPLRLYNIGSRWRYERPQRGRNREFWQLDVDLFGVEGLEGDAEIIQAADAILKSFGAKPEMYDININSRVAMVEAMKEFKLDEAELKRVYKIVDKMPKLKPGEFEQVLAENLPKDKAEKLLEYLDGKNPPQNVAKLLEILKSIGITSAKYEPNVVRGLEYYTDIVFEVFDTSPENARAMFGGGRYDGLVGMFGVETLPTVGFAMGDVTLQNFLETNQLLPQLESETEVAAILIGDVYEAAQKPLNELRAAGMNVAVDSTNRKLDAKIKSAVKSGIKYAVFIGAAELKTEKFKLKNLDSGEEKQLDVSSIVSLLQA